MDVLLLDVDETPCAGHEIMAKLACSWMDSGLARPLVACPKNGRLAACARDLGLPLLPLGGTSLFNPLVPFALGRAARHADVMVSQGRAVGLGAWFAGRGKKCVHVIAHWEDGMPLSRRSLRWYRRAGGIVCATAEMARKLEEALPGQMVRPVDLALDAAPYAPRVERHDGRFVFLALGDLVPARGFEVLVEAMGLLQDMEGLPPWEVRVVGQGPEFGNLLEKARQLEVENHLALLGDQSRRGMLVMADALVAPDVESAGCALTIKEGWASQVPVIASSVAAHAELLRNKDNALLTPAGNPVTLAAAMMRCMQDAALRQQLVENGAESAALYTPERLAEQMVAVCDEALAALSSPKPDAVKNDTPREQGEQGE